MYSRSSLAVIAGMGIGLPRPTSGGGQNGKGRGNGHGIVDSPTLGEDIRGGGKGLGEGAGIGSVPAQSGEGSCAQATDKKLSHFRRFLLVSSNSSSSSLSLSSNSEMHCSSRNSSSFRKQRSSVLPGILLHDALVGDAVGAADLDDLTRRQIALEACNQVGDHVLDGDRLRPDPDPARGDHDRQLLHLSH